MNKRKKSCKETREQVVLFLLFITSDECLTAYENQIPKEKFTFEMSRIWFDEIYSPGMTYLVDGLKGSYNEKDAKEFENCFTEEEFKSLERFHRFFELRVDMVSDEAKKEGMIPLNDLWRNLKKHASYLIAELEPDERIKKRLLGELVKGKKQEGRRLLDIF